MNDAGTVFSGGRVTVSYTEEFVMPYLAGLLSFVLLFILGFGAAFIVIGP